MSPWDDLPDTLDRQQRAVTRDLDALFTDLWQNGATASLLAEIDRVVRLGVFSAADEGARVQHRDLSPAAPHPPELLAFAEQLAFVRAPIVRDRAVEVLSRATAGLVSPYARLAAQILVTDAARKGCTAAGIVGEATHKEFIRIRGVREPRAHSRYEGTVRPVDGTWTIAGIDVEGPGDERLPWSEKAWCGHGLRYFRR